MHKGIREGDRVRLADGRTGMVVRIIRADEEDFYVVSPESGEIARWTTREEIGPLIEPGEGEA